MRPIPVNMNFKRIDNDGIEELICEFIEEEVRRAVWECDSGLSSGPEWVNFGFVKEIWDEIKVDFLRVMGEFHQKL